MADKRDVFDDDFLSHNNEPQLSHTLDKGGSPSGIGKAPIGKKEEKEKSRQGPWHKNPEAIKVAVAVAVVLVLVFAILIFQFDLFGFFGGSSGPEKQMAAAPAAAPQPADRTPSPSPPKEAAKPPAKPTQPKPEEKPKDKGADEKPPEEKEPPLPDDVAKWDREHYFRARREGDPKLLEAIACLCKKYPHKDTVANGLTQLLKPLETEEPAEKADEEKKTPDNPDDPSSKPGKPSPKPQAPKRDKLPGLVEAIVAALGNNGSPPARKTIEGILAGTFKTEDDKAAVEAALKALSAHPCEENDSLMCRVLTKSAELRPYDRQGPWSEKEFQAKAFELAKKSASGRLRLKLAQAVVELGVALNPKDPMHEFLLASDPLNCSAQLAFYEKGRLTPELKTRIEEQFLEYGSLAMSGYLAIPEKLDQPLSQAGAQDARADKPDGLIGGFELPDDPLGKSKPKPDDPADPAVKSGVEEKGPEKEDPAPQIAAGLWSAKFRALLEPKLSVGAADSLEKQAKLVLLAGTIPQDSTRVALNKLLRERWKEGPKALETAGLTDKVVADPGLLTLIKMLPRSDPKSSAQGANRATRPTGGKINKRIEEALKEQKLKEEWMDFSAKLVPLWCKRFHAAAVVRQNESENSDAKTAAPLKLPEGFELSPHARVSASYRLRWPEEAPPEIAALNVGPLEVYYIRVEEMNTPRKATAYYCRQAELRSSDARTIDKVVWLDSVRIGSQKDRRRSLDVLITPPEHYVPADNPRKEDETDLVVEIISIEINDPNR
ncbi:MAG: hypothetical protein JW959_02575 [Pirellulales bacterium]|nr:hypothetical protein [Pirellulales bacterium]